MKSRKITRPDNLNYCILSDVTLPLHLSYLTINSLLYGISGQTSLLNFLWEITSKINWNVPYYHHMLNQWNVQMSTVETATQTSLIKLLILWRLPDSYIYFSQPYLTWPFTCFICSLFTVLYVHVIGNWKINSVQFNETIL
jgi:hypothetical protein